MAEITDQTLKGEIALDGQTFRNCQFTKARLVFSGGNPPSFINCRFNETEFTFEGAAGNTLKFLKAMAPAKTNMRQIVLGLMPELRQN